MKIKFAQLIASTLLAVITQTASADVLLTDNFLVSSNSQNVNQQLSGRQTGSLAPAVYTGWGSQHQVGNSTTDVGQPGGATNSNFVLLAFDSGFFSDLNIASISSSNLVVQFDMYLSGANNPSTDPTSWGACTLRQAGDPFPVANSGEFGFLQRANGGMQVFQSGGNIAPSGWDTTGFATNTHWTLIFSDPTGTGSAFNGNGSQVTFINGTNNIGTLPLGQLNSAGLRLGFRDTGNRFAGIDNLVLSGTPALPPPGHNLSFEYDTTLQGTANTMIPTSWTGFNEAGPADFGTEYPGSQFSVSNPLAPTADGNEYCYINKFSGAGVGGIYQDMGPLQPNTIYTLTVAIGSRADRINSPGIISLLNGTDNTGTVLATGGGIPATQDTWQDYTTTFSTGASVSGDLTIMLSVLGASTIQADFDNVRLTSQQSPIPLPTLVTNITPGSVTVLTGSNVTFSAAFSSSPPVSLQWQQIVTGSSTVTNNINSGVVTVTNNGIVSSTLTLNNVHLANAGSYRLAGANETNFVTVVYTALAPLTVVPPITWYAPGAYNGGFSDDSVLALAGAVSNEVYGVDFGGSGPQTTLNGYTFDDYTVSNNVSLTGTLSTYTDYLNGDSTGDTALDYILYFGLYGSAANTGTLNNLTVGQAYTVLVLMDDTRINAGGPNFYLTDGLTVSPQQRYAFPNGVPQIGGYIMGTFTAQGTSQPLTVLNNGGSQYNVILLMKGTAPAPANPPVVTTDISPLFSEVAIGTPITYSVTGAGSVPLHYQWYNQNGPIIGQTNTSYTFNAVAGTNSYSVTIINPYGSATSSTGVVVSATNIVTVKNFSFEQNVASAVGQVVNSVPTGWTQFNQAAAGDIGSQWAGGVDYSVITPLAPTADGNQYCYINMFNGTPVGGLYQDVGPLQVNTAYTLTVAIGSRADRINSPGSISLVSGSDNTGTVLATGGGLPANQDSWQDYTVSFTNTVSTGDLTVVLSVLGAGTIQADFDNVRLTKASVLGAPVFGGPKISGGNLILTASGGSAGAGYTLLTTTNLAAPITWTTSSTGTFDGNGSFSNSIPVGTAPARFFRVSVP